MLEQVDSHEIAEWEAYDTLEPIDLAARMELSAGIVASTTANCHRNEDVEPFKAADFMPKWKETDEADVETKAIQAARTIENALAGM